MFESAFYINILERIVASENKNNILSAVLSGFIYVINLMAY